MKILIDIGHPAHVHYFRNLAQIFIRGGSEVLFTTRNKEVAIKLLEYYKFDYVNFGKPFKSRPGKIWGLFWFTMRLFIVALRFKPDIYLNATQYAALVAWLMRKPHVSLEDTFNFEQVRLYLPFTSVVLTGMYLHPSLGKKEIRYNGYQELAYLHPIRFCPDAGIKKILGVNEHERYVVLRFVAWNASHDFGHTGLTLENKKKAARMFSKYAKVFISSETELPHELKANKLDIPPERIHDALAFSEMIFSESATMVSEAAMLGVPGIYIDSTGRFYTKDQEKYGMVFNYSESVQDQEKAIQKGIEILCAGSTKPIFADKHARLLAHRIDLTSFLVWFVARYPESKRIMRSDPDHQYHFEPIYQS